MPKQFDLLVFDWDGTLMDSAGAIAFSIQAASRDVGLPAPSDSEARHIIGLGLNEAIAALFPELPRSDYAALVERYRHYYLSQDTEIPLFAGAAETIAALHEEGFLLAVATGKGTAVDLIGFWSKPAWVHISTLRAAPMSAFPSLIPACSWKSWKNSVCRRRRL